MEKLDLGQYLSLHLSKDIGTQMFSWDMKGSSVYSFLNDEEGDTHLNSFLEL